MQSKAQKAGLLDRAALATTITKKWERFIVDHQQSMLIEQQMGEFIWTLVAVAHLAGINAEDALRGYAVQFKSNQQTS